MFIFFSISVFIVEDCYWYSRDRANLYKKMKKDIKSTVYELNRNGDRNETLITRVQNCQNVTKLYDSGPGKDKTSGLVHSPVCHAAGFDRFGTSAGVYLAWCSVFAIDTSFFQADRTFFFTLCFFLRRSSSGMLLK